MEYSPPLDQAAAETFTSILDALPEDERCQIVSAVLWRLSPDGDHTLRDLPLFYELGAQLDRRGIYAQDYLAMSKQGFQSYFRDVLGNRRPGGYVI